MTHSNIYCVYLKEGFVFTGGALRKVQVVGQILTKKEDENGNPIHNDIHLIVRTDKNSENMKIHYTQLYPNMKAYTENIPASPDTLSPYQLNLNNAWRYFTSENGQPVEHEFDFQTIEGHINASDVWDFKADSLPDDYYIDKEICAGMSSFKYVDEEGNEKVHEGVVRKVMLTDEQKEALKAVEDAWKNAQEKGIGFAYDADNCDMLAFNANANGRDNLVVYQEDVNEEVYDLLPSGAYKLLRIRLRVSDMHCEDVIAVKRD